MRASGVRRVAMPLSLVLLAIASSACGDDGGLDACSARVPVVAVAQTIRDQATMVGDTEASRLAGSLGDTLEILAVAAADAPAGVSAAIDTVAGALGELSEALIAVDFDLMAGLEDETVLAALDRLDSDEVAEANVVMESYLLGECGAESLIIDDPSVPTLPTPTLVTSDDEPLTAPPSDDTAGEALARIVAEQFALTLDAEQLACLAERLENPPDPGADATAEDLDRTYERMFRACGIDVALP